MPSHTRQQNEKTRIEIKVLLKKGYSPIQVARKLGVAKSMVQRWQKRKSTKTKKAPKRSIKVTPTTKRFIKRRMYRKFGSSLRKTAAELNHSKRYKNKNKSISYSTVNLHLKTTNWGRHAYRSTKKNILTAKNIIDRVRFGEFCRENGYLEAGKRGQQKRSRLLSSEE